LGGSLGHLIRAIVFDFDGLILDTETPEYQAWQRVYREHGAELPMALWVRCIGTDRSAFDPLEYLESLVGASSDRAGLLARRRAIHDEALARSSALPGVEQYLRSALARGLRRGVASSSSRRWVTGHLSNLGLADYFNTVVCRDDVERVKPDPALYRLATERLGVDPDEALALEDSPNGIAAAKAAGLRCVAVPNPMTRALPLDQADLVVTSLAEVGLDLLLERLE